MTLDRIEEWAEALATAIYNDTMEAGGAIANVRTIVELNDYIDANTYLDDIGMPFDTEAVAAVQLRAEEILAALRFKTAIAEAYDELTARYRLDGGDVETRSAAYLEMKLTEETLADVFGKWIIGEVRREATA